MKILRFSVDRLEAGKHGRIAVLVGEDGHSRSIDASKIHVSLKEGLIIDVPFESGSLDWGNVQINKAETDHRVQEGSEIMERLRHNDSGGDLKL